MQYSDTKNGFMIRFSKGEEIASSIASFCAAHNVTSGYFQAIGAVTEVELGYYHLEKKEYTFKQFEQEFEVVSLTGNVSLVEGKPFVHMHGVFSDEHFQCTGGHVKNGTNPSRPKRRRSAGILHSSSSLSGKRCLRS